MERKTNMEHDTLNRSLHTENQSLRKYQWFTCKYFATNYWISCLTVVFWISEWKRGMRNSLCIHINKPCRFIFLDKLNKNEKSKRFFLIAHEIFRLFAYPRLSFAHFFFMCMENKKFNICYTEEQSFCFVGFAKLAKIIFMFRYNVMGKKQEKAKKL